MGLFKKNKQKMNHNVESSRMRIGDGINFAAKEAYKVLRTNMTFMLNEEDNVFGVTSSISGEGKSLTTINLAISYASMGKRVLIIEADMRKPVLEKYFNVKTEKGLSNALAGHCAIADAIYKSTRYRNLFYIAAGAIPPNPSELLASHKMEHLIEKASAGFDVVIIDLPPVTAVTDAAIVSKFAKGVVLVVRDNYAEKDDLSETVRQLRIAGAKILGFVYNVHDSGKGKYYKKGYQYYASTAEYAQEEDVVE